MKVAAPLIQATSNPPKNSKGESWGNKPNIAITNVCNIENK
jgi:hypothetical protein